ncbi:hypothetical protein Tco_0245524 [Tanacetum coccineum]
MGQPSCSITDWYIGIQDWKMNISDGDNSINKVVNVAAIEICIEANVLPKLSNYLQKHASVKKDHVLVCMHRIRQLIWSGSELGDEDEPPVTDKKRGRDNVQDDTPEKLKIDGIKMRCLLIQHGWESELDPFLGTMTDADKTAALKTDVYKKAHSALLLCLDNKVLRGVNKEDSAAGVWLKLETLYMTKSLANKLYLKKKLFTFYMHSGKKLSEHIDEFNKLISDLANIDIDIDDEDQALMLLTSLPSLYDNFVEALLYGRESLTLEDVLYSLNS